MSAINPYRFVNASKGAGSIALSSRVKTKPAGEQSEPVEPAPRVHLRHGGVAGRTRLRLDPAPHASAALATAARALARHAAVRSVRTNPIILSILVEHDRTLPAEAVAEVALAELAGAPVPTAHAASIPADTTAWHAIAPSEALAALGGDPQGLSTQEAEARLAHYGPNTLPVQAGRNAAAILAGQFKSLPVLLLLGSAGLSIVSGGLLEAVVTLAVVGLNAGIGFSTESWTERLIRKLTRPEEPIVAVKRGGRMMDVLASTVARGDILVLSPGALVAADARLIEADELAIDESVLTGESYPARKSARGRLAADTPLTARTTMAHRGGIVAGGRGLGVVTATGPETEIGRVQRLLGTVRPPQAPMDRELERLGVRLTIGCVIAGGVLMALLRARGAPWMGVIRSGVALAVSAIPEGLPAIAATSKAIAAGALTKQGVLVRNLAVIETSGTVDVLCLDKTGTLTQGRMAATVVRSVRSRHEIDAETHAATPPLGPDSSALARVAILCNDAEVRLDGEILGSGTEAALLALATSAGFSLEQLRAETPRIDAWYRNPARSYMATEHASGDGRLLAVKGAPEQVLALCSTALVGGQARELTPGLRRMILEQNDELAGEGLRVLGFAQGHGGSLKGEALSGLHWLGLVGLADPLRPGAAELVASFQHAGIRPLILTGDQAPTAQALADRLGLSNDGSLDVIDATQLRDMSPHEIADLARTAEVFARVSPTDKLRIVQALQAEGRVVAMTGDGVNDGPALRAANIGIAMGRSGSQIAKDVADVVVAEDGLAAIAAFLARGRSAEENIRRSVRFLLGTNFSETLLLVLEALRGANELESPFELLWLNLVTDVFPALGLALAAPSDDVLSRPPRSAERPLFDKGEITSLAMDGVAIAMPSLVSHLVGMARYGAGPQARGMTFLTLGAAQLAHTLALAPRRKKRAGGNLAANWSIEGGVALSAGLLLAPNVIPPLGRLLGISRPRVADLALALALAAAPLARTLVRKP